MIALLADLQAKGLLGQTLLVVGTEFGRTSRINDNDGWEHHDKVFMCLLVGARAKDEQPFSREPSILVIGMHALIKHLADSRRPTLVIIAI